MRDDLALVLALAVVSVACTDACFALGKAQYAARPCELYDAAHAALPDLRGCAPLLWLYTYALPGASLAAAFAAGLARPFAVRVAWALLVRAVLTTVTVLPPIGACDVERLEARHYVAGHCYDKVPSGHFVVAATLLLLLHRTGRLGAAAAAALAAAVGAGILLLRWHYSIDVAVGALLVLAVDGAVGPP